MRRSVSNHIESIIVAVVFCVVAAGLTWLLYVYNFTGQYSDTTVAAQILYNFRYGVTQQSSLAASVLEAMQHVWYHPAADVCRQTLQVIDIHRPATFHFYTIAYLLFPFARLMDIPLLIALVQALIYSSVLLFTFILARRVGLSLTVSAILVLLVTQHPLWYSGLFGQFYFNRLFLPSCAALLLVLTHKKQHNAWMVLASLIALSTNEIYGITIATILVGYALFIEKGAGENHRPSLIPRLLGRLFSKRQILLYLVAAICLGASYMMLRYIQNHYGSYTTQSGFFSFLFANGPGGALTTFMHNLTSEKSIQFLVVNGGFLGILTLAKPKYFLFLTAFLLPNLLVNIGGAEKIGWSTHYHIGYFVPLIWLSVLAIKESPRLKGKQVYFALAIVFGISMMINAETFHLRHRPFIALSDLNNKAKIYFATSQTSLATHESLRNALKPTDTVSLPEAAAYHFYDHEIYYYPLAIDTVNKVLFVYDGQKPGDARFSTINYGQQDANLDACIIDRMKSDGFDFANPKIIGNWAVISKWYDK